MADELDDIIDDELPSEEVDFDDVAEEIPEPNEKPEKTISTVSQDVDDEKETLKRERDEARAESVRIAKERDDELVRVDTEKKNNLRGNLNVWNNEAASINNDMASLRSAYDIAKIEQDTAKMTQISGEYNRKNNHLENLKTHIAAANGELNKPAPEPKKADAHEKKVTEPTETQKMAAKWVKENPWFDDPEHAAKKKVADAAYKKAVDDGYDPTSIKFWKFIDAQVEKSNTTTRRTAPAVRPVNTSGAPSKMANNGNKANPVYLKEAVKILNMRGIDTTDRSDPEVKRLLKSAYRTVEKNSDWIVKDKANA